MKPIGSSSKSYINELKRRSKESRAYKPYQLTGLEIADILGDREHKALYIKLCKEYGEAKVVLLAKDIMERDDIKNPGAYFMEVFTRMVESGEIKKKSNR